MQFDVAVFDARDGVLKKARIRWGVGDDMRHVFVGPSPGYATLMADVAEELAVIRSMTAAGFVFNADEEEWDDL